ncbi:hypothetical protein N136_00889 [Leifsonia aquatica ATCC 14665]|uniref:Uncharacterized protein n=1 Tax=Leifsonia aquatica ATCC 14665 TaxID=1358026 RepID=U2RBV8_LEIAQ|nr:hypothetical protein N136_00889 [Leifsonia aquatica ATCC 14665]
MSTNESVECSCCGRERLRRQVHALGERNDVYVCRRCGFWIAVFWRGDRADVSR